MFTQFVIWPKSVFCGFSRDELFFDRPYYQTLVVCQFDINFPHFFDISVASETSIYNIDLRLPFTYTDTLSCVRADGRDSDWFLIGSGVRQGCVVAPDQ